MTQFVLPHTTAAGFQRARSLETAGSRLRLRASEIAQYPFCRSHKPTCLQEVRTQLLPFEGRGGSEKPCSGETLRWHGVTVTGIFGKEAERHKQRGECWFLIKKNRAVVVSKCHTYSNFEFSQVLSGPTENFIHWKEGRVRAKRSVRKWDSRHYRLAETRCGVKAMTACRRRAILPEQGGDHQIYRLRKHFQKFRIDAAVVKSSERE